MTWRKLVLWTPRVLLVLALMALAIWIANMPNPQERTRPVPAETERAHNVDQ